MKGLRYTIWLASAFAAAAMAQTPEPAPQPGAAAAELRPYDASYELVTHGLHAGVSSFSLTRDGIDTWILVSRNRPQGLFRLFSDASLTLTSHLRVGPDGVQPLQFTAAPPDGGAPDADLRFDWGKNRVTGVQDGAQIDAPLQRGVQDDLSVQVALVRALLAGQAPNGMSIFDKNGIREYEYTRVGEETLHTAVGDVPTVIYESHKANSPRRTRFWCAPQYNFVPMRAEQKRERQVEWTMNLLSVQLH
jgi:Protein of unknown function (DUF3108)